MNERFEYGRIVRNAGLTPEAVFRAVRLHRRALAGEPAGAVMKRSAKSNVTIVALEERAPDEKICVKEFVRPAVSRLAPAFLRHKPALRSWAAALALQARGVPSPSPLALVLGPGRSSYLLMRVARAGENLRQAVARIFPGCRDAALRREFAGACADFLCDCWEKGVLHRDMKAGNIHVWRNDQGRWEFELIDSAAAEFRARLTPGEMALNLAQLNSSVPRVITRTDRLRCWRDIALRRPEVAGRRMLHEILRLSFARGGPWLQ